MIDGRPNDTNGCLFSGRHPSGDGSFANSTGNVVQSARMVSWRSASGMAGLSTAASGAASTAGGHVKMHRSATQEIAVTPSHKEMQGHGRSCGDWPGQVAFHAARLDSHLLLVAENPPQQLTKPGHSLGSVGAGAQRHGVQSAPVEQVSMSVAAVEPPVPITPPAALTPPPPTTPTDAEVAPPPATPPPVAAMPPVDVTPPSAAAPPVPPARRAGRVRSQPGRKIKTDAIRNEAWRRIERLSYAGGSE
jgi:hypothetical protein